MHFEYTTKPYTSTGATSSAEEVMKDLLRFMPNYKKAEESTYTNLKSQLEFAMANAVRALNQATSSHTDNPTTKVFELVDFLLNLKGTI